MAMSPRRGSDSIVSDFDTSQLLATHEQHEKNISDLTERTVKLEKSLATPQAVAGFFEECAKDSRNFDNVFAKMFCRFLDENQDVKDAVRKRMAEVDRNFFYKTFKRIWLPLYSGLLIIATILAKEIVHWLVSFIPTQ
ncbi:MAG: hypothetical protein QOD99_1458 [Chthoniobacter sp.]|jgi:hypothetical protein|nr:hypothetical protein [Chthoniobacter sp.]